MGVQYKDYYSLLGVSRDAGEKEIKSAYRKLAREYHPDVNPASADKFKDINEAYEVLKDPEKRKLYDSLGSNWRQGQNFTPPPGYEGWQTVNLNDLGGMGGFSSFFESLFGGGGFGGQSAQGGFSAQGFPGGGGIYEEMFGTRQGRGRASGSRVRSEQLNIEEPLYLDLEEVATGVRKEISTPSGKRLSVNIPKGVKPGAKIRLAGEGAQGYGAKGDLLLVVHYRKHPQFRLEDNQLLCEVPVAVPDLVLGAEIQAPTLQGPVSVTIPPGTQPGRLMRLKGQGLPDKSGRPGDLLVRLKALIPENPSEKELEFYRELKKLSEKA